MLLAGSPWVQWAAVRICTYQDIDAAGRVTLGAVSSSQDLHLPVRRCCWQGHPGCSEQQSGSPSLWHDWRACSKFKTSTFLLSIYFFLWIYIFITEIKLFSKTLLKSEHSSYLFYLFLDCTIKLFKLTFLLMMDPPQYGVLPVLVHTSPT